MTDLVKAFFSRDLSEAEHEGLSKLLSESPDEALRYENLLEQNYLATGLPHPALPKGLQSLPDIGGGGLAAVNGGIKLLLVVLALGGLVFWKYWPSPKAESSTTAQPPFVQPLPEKPFAEPLKQVLKKQVPVEPQAAGPAQEGQELNVVVDSPQRSLVTVRILDQAGKEIRVLYTGFVEAGKWNFNWDGLLGNGEAAGAGDYRIDVQTGSAHLFKDIRIKTQPSNP